MKQHFRGATREEMEQAGRALPKKIYQCGMCGQPQSHDGAYVHQMQECSQRPGSTIKTQKG